MTKLVELKYKELIAKQKDMTELFPSFYDRVNKVANTDFQGRKGARPIKMDRDLWVFRVPSSKGDGTSYDVPVYFSGVKSVIEQAAKNPSNWTKDGKHLNLMKLGKEVIYGADILLSSNSPGDLYWGQQYIRTQKGAEYDREENRPPDIRNPEKKGIVGKHAALVLQVLPFYYVTMAGELKKYYSRDILAIEKAQYHPEDKTPAKVAPDAEKPEVEPTEVNVEPTEDPNEDEIGNIVKNKQEDDKAKKQSVQAQKFYNGKLGDSRIR